MKVNQAANSFTGQRKQKGLTLIESVVVLALLAIVALGVFRVAQGMINSANISSDVKIITNVKNKTTAAFNAATSYAGVDSWWLTQRAALGFTGTGATGNLSVGGTITIPASATTQYTIQINSITNSMAASVCSDLVSQLAGVGFADIQVGATPVTVLAGGAINQATLSTKCAEAATKIYLISN